jgi:hypothetical protein
MQRLLLLALTVTVLVLWVPTRSVFAQPQRTPGVSRPPIIDYDPPPATLRGLFADVPVVVRGRVISSSPRRYDIQNRSIPLTAHDFEIDEAFKLDPVVLPKNTSHITVIQDAGATEDLNGKAVTMNVDEIYKPGQELILFLKASPGAGGFTVAYGPAGGFLIRNQEVLIPVRVKSYAEFSGRESIPKATFAGLLHQLALPK